MPPRRTQAENIFRGEQDKADRNGECGDDDGRSSLTAYFQVPYIAMPNTAFIIHEQRHLH
jgi:hypothetical protein